MRHQRGADVKPMTLVDMDNCMVNLLSEWLIQYREMGGEWINVEDITSYGWENFVQNKELFLKILKSGGIFYNARPMYGAQTGIEHLQAIGDVVVVTKALPSSSRTFDAKIHSLWKWFPTIDFKNDVIFTGRKELVHGDFFIDDAPVNMQRWLEKHPSGHGFMPAWRYNESYHHPRCTRVNTLVKAVKLIEEMITK